MLMIYTILHFIDLKPLPVDSELNIFNESNTFISNMSIWDFFWRQNIYFNFIITTKIQISNFDLLVHHSILKHIPVDTELDLIFVLQANNQQWTQNRNGYVWQDFL